MDNIDKVKTCVDASPGSHVVDCIVESIILAMKEKIDVELIHNSKKFLINYEKIVASIRTNEN